MVGGRGGQGEGCHLAGVGGGGAAGGRSFGWGGAGDGGGGVKGQGADFCVCRTPSREIEGVLK